MKYAAFISYCHSDANWATWLHRSLESYSVPTPLAGSLGSHGVIPAKIGRVFKDREELSACHDLGAVLEHALDASQFLVVVCSPSSAASPWVNREVTYFISRSGRERVIPLIVGGRDGDNVSTAECMPRSLLHEFRSDGALGVRRDPPLGIDARRGGDGRDNARLKLIAVLLGVDYDTLRQRDRRRARRRFVAVVATTGVLLFLASALTFESVRNARLAEEARAAEDVQLEVNKGLKRKWYSGSVDPTPLVEAVVMGDLNAVKRAAETSEHLDEPWGSEHFTPLMLACQVGHAEIVAWLLAQGASLAKFDREGMSALHHAAHSNHASLFDTLARFGADLDQRTSGHVWNGQRPIDVAAISGNTDVIAKLIDLGVKIELPLGSGDEYESALGSAAASGRLETVRMLLAAGARTDVADVLGRTMWDAALEIGETSCARLIARAAGVDL